MNKLYNLWLEKAVADPDIITELNAIKDNDEAISDRFYKDLEFGTGGLRGQIGAGTNRMNVYTVGKATQGLAEYVNSVSKFGKVAIAYDSRIKSTLFAKTAAEILAANGIKVYIYSELMPTPMLSFAVRHFGCDAGIVITASHNPSVYNGYKAYGSDGCQLTPDAAAFVLDIMNKVDTFTGVKHVDFDEYVNAGKIQYIEETVINSYLSSVKSRSLSDGIDFSNMSVIYTPLHGSGNKPVRRILDMIGLKNVTVVKEQELPDGNFPTAPYPNPEIKQPFELALKLAETVKPDLLLATDPDCDRVGIAVRYNSEYRLMTGNDVGCLLLDYILKVRTEKGNLPKNPIAVKTIVTSELARKIANEYGCTLIDVLTGFKFIGEQIGLLEAKGEEDRFIFGFEESYGYLAGGYVRDKDAVVASMLICEMVAYYKQKGTNIYDVLQSLYKKHGYFYCSQKSYTFEGENGVKKIKSITENLRSNAPETLNERKVILINDYLNSVSYNKETGKKETILLPSSDVLSFFLSDGCSLIIRPSGTEPKIKFYINAVATAEAEGKKVLKQLEDCCDTLVAD